jgi:hypothetical protein
MDVLILLLMLQQMVHLQLSAMSQQVLCSYSTIQQWQNYVLAAGYRNKHLLADVVNIYLQYMQVAISN